MNPIPVPSAVESNNTIESWRSNWHRSVRGRAEITSFFDGLEIIEPGVVFTPEWRPDEVVT